jgi:glycosyltransferase involved in cell wall biosynthesis
MNDLKDASIIIPIYNQKELLTITLNFMSLQTYPKERFEIIVVDDGSTDGLEESINKDLWPKLECDFKYIKQENQGRAVARNIGAFQARGERLIFCDADRIPDVNFVKLHIENSKISNKSITIGCPLDYFGNINWMREASNESFNTIKRYSRIPQYFTKITNIYNESRMTNSGIVWASFLVGNSSVGKDMFEEVNGFDSDFKTWGFEHFELAFRMQKIGAVFIICPECTSYHIPHSRETGYYRSMIQSSADILKNKYPKYHFEFLPKYLFGEVSLQDFEMNFSGNLSNHLMNREPIYHNIK